MTSAPKKRAPVRLTGHSGTRYENEVAARFLLDMLKGTNSVGADFGHVERVDWQARDTGWMLDDLLVNCRTNSGAKRAIGFSYKSTRQLTQNGFPKDFVEIAWGQWLGVEGRQLARGADAICLVTASVAVDVLDDWNALLREILQSAPDRIVARLQSVPGQGTQSSLIQRKAVEGFSCPARYAHAATNEEVIQLLHDTRVLVFDFGSPTSHDTSAALSDCRSILSNGSATESTELWERLVGIADEMRPVGGTLDLSILLNKLRGQFQLRDHPDYQTDLELLRLRSTALMDDIENRIARIAHLPRTTIAERVREKFSADHACVLTGDSGSGKSALLKELAKEYDLIVWLSREELDHATLVDFQKTLSLQHSIVETLSHYSGSCLVVLDSVEGCSDRGLKLCATLLSKIHEISGSHIDTAASLQLEAVERVVRTLRGYNVPLSRLTAVQCDRPGPKEVHQLLASVPDLQWLSLRPELNPILTNLKVLDWFASEGPNSFPDSAQPLTATGVIDSLWARWTESADDGPARSHLLMEIARIEADTLTYGLPRSKIDGAKQSTLRSLEHAGLIRIREERVYLHHDLLGHWARLRILIGENPDALVHLHQHALSPLWQPAIRLFGQRLLEGTDESRQRWLNNVEISSDASSASSVTRDLFIDALCLATNTEALLQTMWKALSLYDGKLLNLLLRRFTAVATVPDPRVAAFSTPDDAMKIEHLVRIPNWVYWPPVLSFLHGKKEDVARVAPYAAADVCHLWLRTTSALHAQGMDIRWRKEAAEIAYVIAREVQARNLESAYFSEGKDDAVFQAVLYASPFLPTEASALCLELAGRRPVKPAVAERVARVKGERLEAQRAAAKKDKPSRKAMMPPTMGRRHKSEPWPDGPQQHVFSQFRTACFSGDPFIGLVQASADVALEVLLAVSIEEAPDEDDFGGSSMPECGLSYWHEGEPPTYFRGPFLSFLNKAPDEALSFILRLTNFATRRYAREKNWLDINVKEETLRWYGNPTVYRWHHDWPINNAAQMVSALMALEFWLYAELKQGRSVDKALSRIIAESESLAFAGILMNVGKLNPILFSTVLRPLLFVWQLWSWDFQLATLQATGSTGPGGYWGQQARQLYDLADAFYKLPHRSEALLYPNGPIPKQMLGNPDFATLFEEVRTEWQRHVVEDDDDDSLRLLIERLRPTNYSFEKHGDEIVPVFSWPEDIAKKNEADLERLQEEQRIRGLPFQCRKFMHSNAALPEDQAEWLWDFLHSLEPRMITLPTERDDPNWEIIDAWMAGIALLISKQLSWLQNAPAKIQWCRKKLEETLTLSASALHSEVSVGDLRWDSCAAESGIMLLAVDPTDALAKRLVAAAVTAYRYNTTKLVMARSAVVRAPLGDLFMQIIALAVKWSAIRPMRRYQSQEEKLAARHSLIEQFEAGKIPPSIPDLVSLSTELQVLLDEHHEREYPGWKENRAHLRADDAAGRQRKLRAEHLPLDENVVTAAFEWLDLAKATSDAERQSWSALLQHLLKLLLERLPTISPDSGDRLEGSPSEFDNWTLQTVARNIPHVANGDAREALWKPVLAHGAFAHRWVERFFWHWFTNGFESAGSADRFAALWRPMIEYALAQETWDPTNVLSFDLDEIVVQLLALDTRWTRRLTAAENSSIFTQLKELYERALAHWATTSRVVSYFASFVVLPGPSQFLLPATHWLLPHVEKFDPYDWKHGVEEQLIEFLGTCWAQKRDELSADTSTRDVFLKLLAVVTARGSPAAIALSRRIAG